jgi:hypothetical protein
MTTEPMPEPEGPEDERFVCKTSPDPVWTPGGVA